VEMSDGIEGAANLEGADRLQVFRLDPQRPVVVGPACRHQRSAQDVGMNQFRGGADVVDAYQLHDSSLPDRVSVTSGSALTLAGNRTPCTRENTRSCGGTIR